MTIAAVLLCGSHTNAAGIGVFNVRDFKAAGDGEHSDTGAIQKAVDACAVAGGGEVLLPPGRYLAGTIRLKSHVTLWLDAGATLLGTTNLDEYENFTPPAGTPEARFRPQWHRALLLADGAENIGIMGFGTIDGNRVFDPRGEERMRGPHTILLGNCRQIVLRDISIVDAANYAVMLEDCDEVQVRGVRIRGGWDGIHFRGWPGRPCRDVLISDCQFYTGDDAIAGRYWEDVVIDHCLVNSSCNGLRLIGPAERLIVRDCLFYGPGVCPHRTSGRTNMLAAINLQPGAWDRTSGRLDDVLISDVTIRNVTTPFHFALKPGNTAGRITVERVSATGVYYTASSVESWAETPFERVVFRDVNIEFAGGGTSADSRIPVKGPGVDARKLPVWGFYARRVKDLIFDHVRLNCVRDDKRPVLYCDGVEQLTLREFGFPHIAGVEQPLRLEDVGTLRKGGPVIGRETEATSREGR